MSAALHIARGRAVLAQEIEGLEALSEALGGAFSRAVEVIAAHCDAGRGRLIVSGMGKSGHVGHKIAATMASTGTPAYFVHPAEASHGDLGMITAGDCALLLSNSGETQELSAVITHCKRFHVPIIAMVRREGSMLTQSADVALVLPNISEASPVGAPTTSTTMMMALGDALAVALLEQRGFTRERFADFHPGGALGKAFVFVKELMHVDLPLVEPDTLMPQVLIEMTGKRFGCAGVAEKEGALQGVITDGDLRRHMRGDLLMCAAHEVMSKNPYTIHADALAAEALALMNEKSITALFVVDKHGRPEGMLHIHDCLRAGVV